MRCPNCGSEVGRADQYCANCGYNLEIGGSSVVGGKKAAIPSQQQQTSTTPRHPSQGTAWLLGVAAVIVLVVIFGLANLGSGSSLSGGSGRNPQDSSTSPVSATEKSQANEQGDSNETPSITDKSAASSSDSLQNTTPSEGVGDTNTKESSTSNSQDYLIQARDYEFELPSYWRNKVDVDVSGNEVTISPKGILHTDSEGYNEARLASISVVPQDAEMVEGDIGSHLSSYDETVIPEYRIEVWTENWPWIAAEGSYPATDFSTEELAALVDLSSGGHLSYEHAKSLEASDESISMAEYSFSESAFSHIFTRR